VGADRLVGRDEELHLLAARRRSGRVSGVVVAGAQGVGKTSLVAEAARIAATDDGWDVRRAVASTGARDVPLSAFAHLLPEAALDDDDPLRRMRRALNALTAGDRVLIAVDDAHLLDDLSAALIGHALAAPGIFVFMTCRNDEPVPASVVALWKNDFVERLELQAVSRGEVATMARQLLDGDLTPDALGPVWTATLGNPLFVR
jgi:predicted ATPase